MRQLRACEMCSGSDLATDILEAAMKHKHPGFIERGGFLLVTFVAFAILYLTILVVGQ